MVFAIEKELFLGRMGKRQMPEVVKEGGEPNNFSPREECFGVRENVDDIRVSVAFVRDDVEYAAGELHHPERMLEPAVRRTGVNEIRQRELMNVPKALKRPRVDRCDFVGGHADEVVDRIADLVLMLRHVAADRNSLIAIISQESSRRRRSTALMAMRWRKARKFLRDVEMARTR